MAFQQTERIIAIDPSAVDKTGRGAEQRDQADISCRLLAADDGGNDQAAAERFLRR
jgi:hypothetical protein